MIPNFSFKYDGKIFNGDFENSTYAVDDGVEITVKKTEYKEYDAIEWVIYFENKSKKNSGIFSEINDSDILLPLLFPEKKRPGFRVTEGDACVIKMNGAVAGQYYQESDAISATEFAFVPEYLDKVRGNTKSFGNTGGISSQGTMPFFDVTASGAGYITAIGWTGDWRADFTKSDDGIVMKTGLKHAEFYLKPGEKIRTTSTLVMKYSADEDKYNKFRRLIKNHYSHKSCTKAERESLMALELWGGLPSEEMKKRLTELQKYGIRFEDVWIDAGWYGNCTKCDDAFSGDWAKNTGDWRVNPRPHPGGLEDVRDVANDAGMNLMLWFEAERAVKKTPITKEHPEWFLVLPNTSSVIFDYANPEVKKYITELLSGYVKKLNLSCYRQDFNTQLTNCFEANDEENRRGITEIKYITGMYEIWDSLLEHAPHLLIDNCSGGGRRIDIETLKRSIPFFRSDYQCAFNENPEVLQVHNSGISSYLPYNGCTSKTKSDTYAIRSSYSSSWGGAFYNAIFQSMTEDDFLWAKKVTDEYRRIRKYMSCDFYNHASRVLDDTAWTVWQYHDPETDSGIVMAFRRTNSPFESMTVELKGINKDRVYTAENLNDGSNTEIKDKMTVTLTEKRSSVIFEYK